MSTQPYGKFSGMTPKVLTPANDGTTQAFVKETAAHQVGDQATEGDIFRLITNMSTTATLYLGETTAQANGADAYPLAPGKDFVLLGPSGAGWKGDLYVKGDAAAQCATLRF